MKVLVTIENCAKVLGIRRLEPDQTNPFNRRNICVLLIYVLYFISTTAFLLFDANTFQEFTECFFAFITVLFISIGFLLNILKTTELFQLQDTVEKTIENYIDSESTIEAIFINVNEKIEKWTRIVYILFVRITVPLSGIPLFLISYYFYFVLDLGPDSFLVFEFLKLPINTKTPCGYAVSYVAQSFLFVIVCHTVMCVLGVIIGFYGLARVTCRILKQRFRLVDENFKADKNVTEMNEEIRFVLGYHTEIKDMATEFVSLMQYNISLYYVWSILAICDTLLMLQVAKRLDDLIIPLAMMFWSFVQIFLLCELGERLTDHFNDINNEIYKFDWYRFPKNMQKVVLLSMNGTLISFELRGFGNLPCTREAFKNVTTGGFSYFTMIRRI